MNCRKSREDVYDDMYNGCNNDGCSSCGKKAERHKPQRVLDDEKKVEETIQEISEKLERLEEMMETILTKLNALIEKKN